MDVRGTNIYYWAKNVSDHCCLHCDGTVYKADTEIETTELEDECRTVQTLGKFETIYLILSAIFFIFRMQKEN